jgi:Tol biopolymer transport system component
MKRLTTLAIAGAATLAALTVPTAAAAHPTASPKPTGTIFFFRENAKGNGQNIYSMTAAGKSAHRVKHVQIDTPVFPAPKAHLLVYTVRPSEFKRDLVIANYKGKRKHLYKPKNFVGVQSVSPNGKYLGIELAGSGAKSEYAIATIKGKIVAKLFSFSAATRQVAESWNASSTEVAIVNTSNSDPSASSSLKIYNRKGKVVRTLVKNTGGSFNVAWSKNGDVAFSLGNDISVIKDNGGTPRVLVNTSPNFPNDGLSYSPNGDFLVYGLYVSGSDPVVEQVWRVTASGKKPHKLSGKGTEPLWG